MYKLILHYHESATSLVQDVNTFDFATDLMLRGVYTEQPSDNELLFDSQEDLTYAVLRYSGSARLEWDTDGVCRSI